MDGTASKVCTGPQNIVAKDNSRSLEDDASLAAVDPDEDDWATHIMNAIVTEVNQLRKDVAENEIMQEEADVPNIHLHLSAIYDESTDTRPIMEHLKFMGPSTNALSENASLVDVRVEELEKFHSGPRNTWE